METLDIIGYVAGACTTLCYIPQVAQAVRSGSVKDLSLWMCILLLVGVLGWTCYGIMIGSTPMIVFNSISVCLVGGLLALKIYTEFLKPSKTFLGK